MSDAKVFLKETLALPGLSGFEKAVADRIVDEWKPLTDEVTFSKVGSVHAHKRGTAKKPLKVLLSAHMDGIGMMVKGIEGDFLRIVPIGGLDIRVLPGTWVNVHGKKLLKGLIVTPPGYLMPDSFSENDAFPIDALYIDTGLEEKELKKHVEVGTLVSFGNDPFDLTSDWVTGHSLDNRASVAAVTVCLQELQGVKTVWDVVAVASVQEEETMLGAKTSPFAVKPDLAIAIDVTFATGPFTMDEIDFYPLGKGIPISMGPNIHPKMFKLLKKAADDNDIPNRPDFMTGMSGTDAVGLQVAEAGIPTGLINIPLRYMHTQVEVVSWTDIRRAGKLMAKFIRNLDEDSMKEFEWED